MNWLAHIYLSEQNIYFQIGNYLADPLKGKSWDMAHEQINKGMQIHKLIDSFTDSHEIFIQSKKRLGDKGLLKPVIVDMTYDYFLTKNWEIFCNEEFEVFTHRFYKEAFELIEFFPSKVQIPINRMVKNKILNKYTSMNDIKRALERLDKRLSPRLLARETSSSYYGKIEDNIEELEKDFMIFFPQLCKEVKKSLDESLVSHWKI